MGALAGLLKAAGDEVRGSDQAVYPPMSDQLAALQIPVFEGYSAKNLTWGPDIVVVGNVISKGHVEVDEAERLKLPLTSLPAVLGERFLAERHSIVVAGTHGKTTTSSLLTHILLSAGRDPGCFIGGVPIASGQGWRLGSGGEFVVEGDEYDSAFFDKGSKFLHYRPRSAILTSVELDHVDIFQSLEDVRKTFRKFVKLIPNDGLLVVCADSREALKISESSAKCRVETYRIAQESSSSSRGGAAPAAGSQDSSGEGPDSTQLHISDWSVHDIEYQKSGRCQFSLMFRGEPFDRYETLLNGAHNLGNVAAAVAVAHSLGISNEQIRHGVATFAGVRRRQEVRGIAQGVRVIDDYGHHPSEVAATLQGLRRRYTGSRVVAVYEPRSATSRRKTFQKEYAQAFAHADRVVVGKLYDPSRIAAEDRFVPEKLAFELHQAGTPATYCANTSDIVAHVVDVVRPGDVVVVFSSGAFDGLHEKLLNALGDAVIPARRADMPIVRELLRSLELDWRDVTDDDNGKFLLLINETGIVGCVGLEVFGEDAVLRSLAVRPAARGAGYGWMLADSVINRARFFGVRRIYLITEYASDFFAAKHGFRVVDLSTVAAPVVGSVTFRTPKGKSAIAMRLDV
jgi:UDP-N-acetylmuramate: L-alanyl-gamma-D-glutamyl-meso-diaminopimelate ligase